MLNWRAYVESEIQKTSEEAFPEYYVPLNIRAGRRKDVGTESDLWDLVKNSRAKVLLSGRPGCGKSFVVAYLHQKFAQDLRAEIETFDYNNDANAAMAHPETVSTFIPSAETIIPVLIRLNRFDRDRSYLESKVVEMFKALGLQDGLDLRALLLSGPRFVFLIDDLDEVASHNWAANLDEVREFIEKVEAFPSVQIVLAGRESAANRFTNRFRTYRIAQLDAIRVNELFALVLGGDEGGRLYNYVEKLEGLLDFLSTPFFAVEAADFWSNPGDKDFNLGRLLYTLIDHLIYRQEKTEYHEHIYSAIGARVEALEQLAVDGLLSGGSLGIGKLGGLPDDYIEWYRFMEFITHDVIEPQFASKWLHGYFAAHYLTNHERYPSSDERKAFLTALLKNPFPTLSTCIVLLQDLTGENYLALLPDDEQFANSFTQGERDWLGWGFEQKVCDYIRESIVPNEISSPYTPPYLGKGEIDVYAVKQRTHNSQEIWVVECKFRFPRYPRQLKPDYLEQLRNYRTKVEEHIRPHAEQQGKTTRLKAVLVTNNTEFQESDIEFAKSHKLSLWNVRLHASHFTARSKITDQLVEKVL